MWWDYIVCFDRAFRNNNCLELNTQGTLLLAQYWDIIVFLPLLTVLISISSGIPNHTASIQVTQYGLLEAVNVWHFNLADFSPLAGFGIYCPVVFQLSSFVKQSLLILYQLELFFEYSFILKVSLILFLI